MQKLKLGAIALLFLSFVAIYRLKSVSAAVTTQYKLTQRYAISGDGGWDYISVDASARRIYASHGDRVEVLDADTGKPVGQILDTPGVHGVAIASDLHKGFTSNGRDGTVSIFDILTLKTIKKVNVNHPDFILYDEYSRRVFPLSQKITVLDAETGNVVSELDLQGKPEAGVSDGKGKLYINLADKAALAVVDSKALTILKTFTIDYCTSPHSLSYDSANERLFVGCRDGLAVLSAETGKIVGRSLMCSGVDAGGFDAENKLIFESCAEGVVSVIRQTSLDDYELDDTVKTQLFAKTMAFDVKSKRIFLPTAEFETVNDSGSEHMRKRQIKSGSFTILVLEPQ